MLALIRTIAVWLLVITILSSSLLISAVEIEGECTADDQTCTITNSKTNDENSFEFGTDTAPVPDTKRSTPPECEDKEDRCGGWAKVGECDANPNYMLSEYMYSVHKMYHCVLYAHIRLQSLYILSYRKLSNIM